MSQASFDLQFKIFSILFKILSRCVPPILRCTDLKQLVVYRTSVLIAVYLVAILVPRCHFHTSVHTIKETNHNSTNQLITITHALDHHRCPLPEFRPLHRIGCDLSQGSFKGVGLYLIYPI